MSFFDWDQRFSTGIESIDDEHKKLFAMVSALHAAMQEGHGHQKLGEMFASLEAYTLEHFSREEKLMEQYVFPGLVAHHREHSEIKERLANLKDQYTRQPSGLSIPALKLLKEWLTSHVQGTDLKYAPFLKSKGVS